LRFLIKSRLAALGLKSNDLIAEINKRGERINAGDFSNYISGKKRGDTADRVCELCDTILKEKELKAKGKKEA